MKRRAGGSAPYSAWVSGAQTKSTPLRLVKPWCTTLWPMSHRLKGVSEGRKAMRPSQRFRPRCGVRLWWQASWPMTNSRPMTKPATRPHSSLSQGEANATAPASRAVSSV